jgi:hypothetical protein
VKSVVKIFSEKQYLWGLWDRGAGIEQKVTKGGKDAMADTFFVIFVAFCSSFSVGSVVSCVEQEVTERGAAATKPGPPRDFTDNTDREKEIRADP